MGCWLASYGPDYPKKIHLKCWRNFEPTKIVPGVPAVPDVSSRGMGWTKMIGLTYRALHKKYPQGISPVIL